MAFMSESARLRDSCMEPHNEPAFWHSQTAELMKLLDQDYQVVQVIGPWGSGKSTLLYRTKAELTERGRPVFYLSCRRMWDTDGFGLAVLDAVRQSPFNDQLPDRLTIRSSAGGLNIIETASILRELGQRLRGPILMFDDLSEIAYPARMTSGIEQLALDLPHWTFVVASDAGPDVKFTRSRRLTRIFLRRPLLSEAPELARALTGGLLGPVADQVACLRWPVEEGFEFGKDHFGLDHSQVRLYTALLRHIVLTLAALAVCAITAAQAKTRAPAPILPTTPDEPPPADLGLIALTVAEIKRLFMLVTRRHLPETHHLHWVWWRRRHQARARWYHHRTRLRRDQQT
jgi:hypothetical protein